MPKTNSANSKNKTKSTKTAKEPVSRTAPKASVKAASKSHHKSTGAVKPVNRATNAPAAQSVVHKGKVESVTIEKYFSEMGIEYHTIAKGMWKVSSDGVPNIIVSFEPPVVVIRLKLMETGDIADHFGLFKRLLELNSEQMISGAFGLEGDNIVAVEVLQSENLDLNELQAAIEGLTLTAMQNYHELKEYRSKEVEATTVRSRAIKGGTGYHDDPGFVF